MKLLDSSGAVSYTHLDVYKRQVPGHGCGRVLTAEAAHSVTDRFGYLPPTDRRTGFHRPAAPPPCCRWCGVGSVQLIPRAVAGSPRATDSALNPENPPSCSADLSLSLIHI